MYGKEDLRNRIRPAQENFDVIVESRRQHLHTIRRNRISAASNTSPYSRSSDTERRRSRSIAPTSRQSICRLSPNRTSRSRSKSRFTTPDRTRSKSMAPEDRHVTWDRNATRQSYARFSPPSLQRDRRTSRSKSIGRQHSSPPRGQFGRHSFRDRPAHISDRQVATTEYQRVNYRHTRVYKTKPSQLFVAWNYKSVGLLMDREYNVFYINKKKQNEKRKKNKASVVAERSWALKIAMDVSTRSGSATEMRRYVIHRYLASKEFFISFLQHLIDKSNVIMYTNLENTFLFDKIFQNTEGYTKLKDTIKYLEKIDMCKNILLDFSGPRSLVCLFRRRCSKVHDCVYCQLEALKTYMNGCSDVRVEKQIVVGDKERGVVNKFVTQISKLNGSKIRFKSRSSSSSSSSSSSTSSSSSSSSSQEDDDSGEEESKQKVKTKQKKTNETQTTSETEYEEEYLRLDTEFDGNPVTPDRPDRPD